MAEAFTFFEKFGDVCSCLNEADCKELMYAICKYGSCGEEVELPYMLKALFVSLKEDIDNSKNMRARGAKGGRPSKKSQVGEVIENDKPEFGDDENPNCDLVYQSDKPVVSDDSQKIESQANPNQASPIQPKPEQAKDGDAVRVVVAYLNDKTGKHFKASSKANARHIRARLNEGYTVDDLKAVVDAKVADWLGVRASDGRDMGQYLCPETLFGSKFEKYLNQKATPRGGAGDEYSAL